MGRPRGTKNGQGASRELADSTSFAIRLQRVQSVSEIEDRLNYGILCTYCQRDMTFDPMMDVHADHGVAYDNGGATNASNLFSACANCNHQKGDKFDSIQFAFLKASEKRDPVLHMQRVQASLRLQATTPVNFTLGRVAWSAWRELTNGMTSNNERREVTVKMVLERMSEIAADVELAA